MPKILAVDDSVTMRKVIELTFQALDGFAVTTFDSAQAAIAHAQSSGADLVIADTSMSPDGYEVCRQLKTTPTTRGIPVLLLGSKQLPVDAAKAQSVGADDTATKPYDTNGFIERVKRLLAQRSAEAASGPVATYRTPPLDPTPKRPTLELADDDEPLVSIDAPAAAPAPARPPVPGVIGGRTPASPASRPATVRHTVGFGAPIAAVKPASSPGTMAASSASAAPSARTLSSTPSAAAGARPTPAASAARAASAAVGAKLDGMGLTPEQIQAVLALTREVVERVVWEVVPDLAETLIREEIARLTR